MMPVARRTPKLRNDDVPDVVWAVMLDEIDPDDIEDGWDRFDMMYPSQTGVLASHWRERGADIVERWVDDHPGTRPSCWWLFDAPKPRRVVEGMELAPISDRSTLKWLYEPATQLIESEAAYLRRHGLLLPNEATQLVHADYRPEQITRTQMTWMSPGAYGVPRCNLRRAG
jgi:hypothetical protein